MTLENATLANISFSDTQIKIKRGTAADWAAANPILEAGELGYITDSNLLKVGDGTTAFNSLGGGVGLTEAEVKTLIGRGKANGTAALDTSKNLLVPWAIIKMRNGGSSGSCNLYSGSERVFETYRVKANDYRLRMNKDNVLVDLLDASDRNGATNTAVAAIYNPCKTIFNEHRPVCTKEYHLIGKYLDGAENPDVWYPIKGAGTGASVAYLDRELKLNCGSGMISASRCVIDQTKFPILGNFLEVTCEIGSFDVGEGGARRAAIGFQPAFSGYSSANSDRATIVHDSSGWNFCGRTEFIKTIACPIARELQTGDIVTIRLDRQEGSSDIDIARFYVNGQKQWETLGVPTANVYAGLGVFATNSLVDVGMQLGIKYFGVRYSPGSGGEAIQNIEVINEPEETGEVIDEPEVTGEVID